LNDSGTRSGKVEDAEFKTTKKGEKIMKFRKWILLFSTVFFIFCAGSGIVKAADKEPINIGAIASLTGYLSDQAQNVVEGTELAVEEINAKGGLLGRPLKLHIRDDEMKPPVGVRRFEDLVKNQGIVMHTGVVFAPIASSIQQTNKQLSRRPTTSNKTPKICSPIYFLPGAPWKPMAS
jgi:ABC-type branched-subunit amino acid transport system substrate-binding protein